MGARRPRRTPGTHPRAPHIATTRHKQSSVFRTRARVLAVERLRNACLCRSPARVRVSSQSWLTILPSMNLLGPACGRRSGPSPVVALTSISATTRRRGAVTVCCRPRPRDPIRRKRLAGRCAYATHPNRGGGFLELAARVPHLNARCRAACGARGGDRPRHRSLGGVIAPESSGRWPSSRSHPALLADPAASRDGGFPEGQPPSGARGKLLRRG